jgi:hypothetical protein
LEVSADMRQHFIFEDTPRKLLQRFRGIYFASLEQVFTDEL